MHTSSPIPDSVSIQKQLTFDHMDEWLQEDVFHIRWWILIGFILLLAVLWLLLVNKVRLREILLFAALAEIMTMGIDEYGQELILWDYPTDVIPIFPPLTSVNLMILPLTFSLLHQYFPTFKKYFTAVAIAVILICLAIEPLLILGGFYQMIHWRTYLSIPLYLGLALIVRFLTVKIMKLTDMHKGLS